MTWMVLSLFMLGLFGSIIVDADFLSDIVDGVLDPLKPAPETTMNAPEIIAYNGYALELHNVTTNDSYILQMHRIPHGKNGTGVGKGQPVLLQHGLLCDSSIWVWNIGYNNLAFLLADLGYDVWLGNFRGNKYAQLHVYLSASDNKFWQFSWDQMAAFDLPAEIDYILNITGYKKILYCGHSMGTTTMFALLSTQLPYNDKVACVAALAPVATVGHMKSPIRALSEVPSFGYNAVSALTKGKLAINDGIINTLLTTLCSVPIVNGIVCETLLFLIDGPDYAQLKQSRLGVYFNKYPADTSVMALQHYMQEVNSSRFCHFDYGATKNNETYKQLTPPDYDLKKITAPIGLFWALNDWLAAPADVSQIPGNLTNLVLYYQVQWAKFTHMDFIAASNASGLVNVPVLNLLKNYTSATK